MLLSFDQYGHIKPDKVIPISLIEIEVFFVNVFPQSETRLELFTTLTHYIRDLQTIVGTSLHIFINGSFVTQKENPNDIDLVVFVDYDIFMQNESKLFEFRCNLRHRKLVKYIGIDAYIEKIYPQEHPHYHLDYLHWMNFFSKDRKGRKKGFLLLDVLEASLQQYNQAIL